jgi:hypothetical protein
MMLGVSDLKSFTRGLLVIFSNALAIITDPVLRGPTTTKL